MFGTYRNRCCIHLPAVNVKFIGGSQPGRVSIRSVTEPGIRIADIFYEISGFIWCFLGQTAIHIPVKGIVRNHTDIMVSFSGTRFRRGSLNFTIPKIQYSPGQVIISCQGNKERMIPSGGIAKICIHGPRRIYTSYHMRFHRKCRIGIQCNFRCRQNDIITLCSSNKCPVGK